MVAARERLSLAVRIVAPAGDAFPASGPEHAAATASLAEGPDSAEEYAWLLELEVRPSAGRDGAVSWGAPVRAELRCARGHRVTVSGSDLAVRTPESNQSQLRYQS